MKRLNRKSIERACAQDDYSFVSSRDKKRMRKQKGHAVEKELDAPARPPLSLFKVGREEVLPQVLPSNDAPIKLWARSLDANAWKQVQDLAKLPFIHPQGIALMPDVHVGNGACVGSVLPFRQALVPSSIGVDSGCFRGDTKIALLDGTQATLLDLEKRTECFWVYSINSHGKIVPGKAKCVKTRSNTELMRIVVSGGDEIICTPDHEFMLSDGTYREAKDLRFNESLMPLYRKWQTRDGYESVSNGKGNSAQTHVMVWKATNGKEVPSGFVIHHLNHCHFDNRPENLELMEEKAHFAHHRNIGFAKQNIDPQFQKARRAGVARRLNDPEYQKQLAEIGGANFRKYMAERPEHFKNAVANNGKRGAPYLSKFNTTPRICSDCAFEAKNPAELRWHKKNEHNYNHKVISVQHLEEKADVYCLQVEEHHNFALAAGVFVHNCGMQAVQLSLKAEDLPDDLRFIRLKMEENCVQDEHEELVDSDVWAPLHERYKAILQKHPRVFKRNAGLQLGTLGGGNHFNEICLDENRNVWVMLHSGSRGVGNNLGKYFIEKALRRSEAEGFILPNRALGYLPEGCPEFDDYLESMLWAQDYAKENRKLLMQGTLKALQKTIGKKFSIIGHAVSCHHNYVAKEVHFGEELWITRKGAVRAGLGELALIPGSMGNESFVVRGKGNLESYCSCAHGAGRLMSRGEAKQSFTTADLRRQTEGVECRKDKGIIDEIPSAYKPIREVMNNQLDLVDIVHRLKQIVCVKSG